jgi:hypothetical protein
MVAGVPMSGLDIGAWVEHVVTLGCIAGVHYGIVCDDA